MVLWIFVYKFSVDKLFSFLDIYLGELLGHMVCTPAVYKDSIFSFLLFFLTDFFRKTSIFKKILFIYF